MHHFFGQTFNHTDVRDQLPAPFGQARNYGHGLWEQQWLGLKRMVEFVRKTPRQCVPSSLPLVGCYFRMLLLTFVPFLVSVVIWGIALGLGLQPLVD